MALYEALANAIRTRIEAEVENGLGLSVGYDNAPFTPPVDTTFAVTSVRPAGRRFATAGPSGIKRVRGALMVTVFAPEKTGDSAANAIADSVADLFTRVRVGAAQFETAEVVSTGKGSGLESGWWKAVVNCPFYADE